MNRRVAAILTLVAAHVIGACGGGNGESEGSASSGPNPEPPIVSDLPPRQDIASIVGLYAFADENGNDEFIDVAADGRFLVYSAASDDVANGFAGNCYFLDEGRVMCRRSIQAAQASRFATNLRVGEPGSAMVTGSRYAVPAVDRIDG